MWGMFDALLTPGAMAPDFTLQDDSGNTVRLSEQRAAGPLVLVFYPMDETPGCRAQLCEIRDHWEEFRRRGVSLFGVNPATAASHAKFRCNHRLPFPLLVDKGKKVARLYGAGGFIVRRTVYAIGAGGRILFAERGKPAPHRILDAISQQS